MFGLATETRAQTPTQPWAHVHGGTGFDAGLLVKTDLPPLNTVSTFPPRVFVAGEHSVALNHTQFALYEYEPLSAGGGQPAPLLWPGADYSAEIRTPRAMSIGFSPSGGVGMLVLAGSVGSVGHRDTAIVAYNSDLQLQWSIRYSPGAYDGADQEVADVQVLLLPTGEKWVGICGNLTDAFGTRGFVAAWTFSSGTPQLLFESELPGSRGMGMSPVGSEFYSPDNTWYYYVAYTNMPSSATDRAQFALTGFRMTDGQHSPDTPLYFSHPGGRHLIASSMVRGNLGMIITGTSYADGTTTGSRFYAVKHWDPNPPPSTRYPVEWTFEDAEATHAAVGVWWAKQAPESDEMYLYILGRQYDSVAQAWGLKLVQYDELTGQTSYNDWISEHLTGPAELFGDPRGLAAGEGSGWTPGRPHGRVDAVVTGRFLTASGAYDWGTHKFESNPDTGPKPFVWDHAVAASGTLDSPMGVAMWTRDEFSPDLRHNAFITGLRLNGSNGYDLRTVRLEEIWP
jgi:hypothetical protein